MEVVAAVGAVPGLASATIQLGITTFNFVQQIYALQKSIKQGKHDLETAFGRLIQHEGFISELKHSFESIPDGHVTDNLRILFQAYVADSEKEVKEFRELLDNIGKHWWKGKTLRAIETGTRLHIKEETIQKYCKLLDAQIARFLYLQSSAQNSRTSVLLSGIDDTLSQQSKSTSAYCSSIESNIQKMELAVLSQLQSISDDVRVGNGRQRSHELGRTNSSSQPCSTMSVHRSARSIDSKMRHSSFEDDQIAFEAGRYDVQVYSTLCGWITVLGCNRRATNATSETQDFACRVRFTPFSWISKSLVEWRCFMSSSQKVPLLMLSGVVGTVCEDADVIDALGFIPCKSNHCQPQIGEPLDVHWHTKMPNHKGLEILLDNNRLSCGDCLEHPFLSRWGRQRDILSAFVSTHQLCKRKNDAECWLRWNSPEKYHCCRSDPTYHSKFYIEYYEVIKLLLRRGFQPCLSSWRFLLSHVVRDRWHIEHAHPELRSSIDFSYRSVPLLIQEAAGFAVPVLSANTFDDKLEIWFPRIYTAYSEQYSAMSNGFSHEVDSHLTSIITLEHASDTITKEFLTLDVPDLAGDEFIFDRWLLVIFSFFDTSLDRLLQNYLKSYSNKEIRSLFQVQKVLEELRYIQDRSSPGLSREKWIELSDKQWELIRYICFNGSLEMLKWLADNEISLSPGLIATAQSQDKEKFDFAFSLGTFYWNFQSPLLHTEMLRRRLVEEPEFRCRILNRLFFESSHYNFIVAPDEPILGFLRCDMIIDLLWIPESYKLPEYIVLLIEGLIQRYESATHIISGREIYGIVRGAMRFHWDRSRSAHEVTRSKHLYQVLRRIATLPAFRCALDYLGGGEYYDGVPLTRGRTNHSMYEVHPNPSVNGCTPLMVALHCGMSPVVQILVDAGASILLRSLNGKSPLQLAYENVQAVHPRPWAAAFDRKDGVIISGLMPYSGDRLKGPAEKLWVSESMDKAMLEILLTALRDRGEDVNEAELVMEPLTDTAWMRMKTRTKSILAWLMRPSYHFDIDEFRQKSAYVAMITTLWVLSILKLLKLKFGPYVPVVVDLLSRPVIILSLVVCIASMLIR